MLISNVNVFDKIDESCCMVCVTTNGIVKSNGELVMGAGVAKQFANKFPELPRLFGKHVKKYGNTPCSIVNKANNDVRIVSFPTKHNYKDKADLDLIIESAKRIYEMSNDGVLRFYTIYIPSPGTGLGMLDKTLVYDAISEILHEDRFVICDLSHVGDTVRYSNNNNNNNNMEVNEMKEINNFRNEYYFLSNMYTTNLTINEMNFTCAESLFQACKCETLEEMSKFTGIDGFKAKKLGRQIKLRSDWESIKVDCMENILRNKFSDAELMKKLLDTNNTRLIEGNTWHDNFWGSCTCAKCNNKGKNILGGLLMKIRNEYSALVDPQNNNNNNTNNNVEVNEMSKKSNATYTGIGSRNTPSDYLQLFSSVATTLAELGCVLRSGGAFGADKAFESGCDSANGDKEIYIPWKGFNDSASNLVVSDENAFRIAEKYHPNWSALSQGARKLQARNSHQILGNDLNSPANFVICWTKEGRGEGGTGQAIRIAKDYGIPVFDCGSYRDIDNCKIALAEFICNNSINKNDSGCVLADPQNNNVEVNEMSKQNNNTNNNMEVNEMKELKILVFADSHTRDLVMNDSTIDLEEEFCDFEDRVKKLLVNYDNAVRIDCMDTPNKDISYRFMDYMSEGVYEDMDIFIDLDKSIEVKTIEEAILLADYVYFMGDVNYDNKEVLKMINNKQNAYVGVSYWGYEKPENSGCALADPQNNTMEVNEMSKQNNNTNNNMEVNEMSNYNNNVEANELEVSIYKANKVIDQLNLDKEIKLPRKFEVRATAEFRVEIETGNIVIAINTQRRVKIYNLFCEEVRKEIPYELFNELYKPYSVEIFGHITEEMIEASNKCLNMRVPYALRKQETQLTITNDAFRVVNGVNILITHDNNNEKQGKGVKPAWREVMCSENTYTWMREQKRNKDDDFYGELISFEVDGSDDKLIGEGLNDEPKYDNSITVATVIEEGFIHMKNGKIQCDKNGEPIMYGAFGASASKGRAGNIYASMINEFDSIYNSMFVGLEWNKIYSNVLKTISRATLTLSNGTILAWRDQAGNPIELVKFNYKITNDISTTGKVNAYRVVRNDKGEIDDCVISNEEKEINLNDGLGEMSIKAALRFALHVGLISQEQEEYARKQITINSMKNFGIQATVKKFQEIADKNEIQTNCIEIAREYLSGDDNVLNISKALKEMFGEELFELALQDDYYFSHINNKFFNSNRKLRSILDRVPSAFMIRYAKEFAKGMLVVTDLEKRCFGAEINLTHSMTKMHKYVEKLREQGKDTDDTPWVVCQYSEKQPKYNQYNAQFWKQLAIPKDLIMNISQNVMDNCIQSFTKVEKALEVLNLTGKREDFQTKSQELLYVAPELVHGTKMIQELLADQMKSVPKKLAVGKTPVEGGFYKIIPDIAIFGGCDSQLQPGEYYLNGLTCEALISRNPAMNYSENAKIHLVCNENTKHLHHIKDVLVMNTYDFLWIFLGGADFDGDFVFVCFNKDMIASCVETEYGTDIGDPYMPDAKDDCISYKTVSSIYSKNVKGSPVGLETNKIFKLHELAFNSFGFDGVKGNIKYLALGTILVGKVIDQIKTGEVIVLSEKLASILESTLLVQPLCDFASSKLKKGHMGTEKFWYNSKGVDMRTKDKYGRDRLGYSQQPLNVNCSYMQENYKVLDKEMAFDKYKVDSKAFDEKLVNTLKAFIDTNVEKQAKETIFKLEAAYRRDLAKLNQARDSYSPEEWDRIYKDMLLNHQLIFETTCEAKGYDIETASYLAYIAPIASLAARPFNQNDDGTMTKREIKHHYAINCAYDGFYSLLVKASSGLTLVKLPVVVYDSTITVLDNTVSINNHIYRVNAPNGEYDVISSPTGKQFIRVFVARETRTTNKECDFAFQTSRKGLPVFGTKCPLGTSQITPLSAIAYIMANNNEFRVEEYEGELVMYCNNHILGILENNANQLIFRDNNICGKTLKLVIPSKYYTDGKLNEEFYNELVNKSGKGKRAYDFATIPQINGKAVKERISFLQYKVVGVDTPELDDIQLQSNFEPGTGSIERDGYTEDDSLFEDYSGNDFGNDYEEDYNDYEFDCSDFATIED